MENLKIGATKYTPEISFDCEKNILDIIGESYPENIAEFYAPVFKWLEQYIEQLKNDQNVTINMELIYFNSSSSKVLLDFLDILEQAVKTASILP